MAHDHLLGQVVLLVDEHGVALSDHIVFVVAEKTPWVHELLRVVRSHLLLNKG